MKWWQEIMPIQGLETKDELLKEKLYNTKRNPAYLSVNGPDPEKTDKVQEQRRLPKENLPEYRKNRFQKWLIQTSDKEKEQLSGIEQINNAISILDRVTQENANESNNVSNITNETLSMALLLVEDARSKKVN